MPRLLSVLGVALVIYALAAVDAVTAAFAVNESWARPVLPVQ